MYLPLCRWGEIGLFCLWVAAPAADGPPPDLAPSVRSIFPLGAAAGETMELSFLGRRLNDLTDMLGHVQLRDYEVSAPKAQRFKSVSDLAAATGAEARGVELDYDIFANVKPPSPETPRAVYRSADFDFRLKPGSKAVDAGVRLPDINDDFTGQAPDLGAYEGRKPLPVYGPRLKTSQPFHR